MDECEADNGGCGQVCTNTPGSFSCNCQSNYILTVDGRTCILLNHLISTSTSPPPTSAPPTTTESPTTTEPPTTTAPPTTERQCGSDMKSSNGSFQTLNWPVTYPINIDCLWTIEAPNSNKVLEISFDSSVFGIAGRLPDCEKDWLKVYDGLYDGASVWGPFCHLQVPQTLQTSSSTAKIVFHAGPVHSPSRRGFKASYRSVARPSVPQEPRPVPETP